MEAYPWENLLRDQIFDNSTIESTPISSSLMKPLLYHFYCLCYIQAPDTVYDLEIDHIIPQTLFKESSIPNREIIKDNILNLGILPKDDNVAKSNKKLILIDSQWLKDQIKKYEFISEEKFQEYSDVNNYEKMFNEREDVFLEAYGEHRDKIINN